MTITRIPVTGRFAYKRLAEFAEYHGLKQLSSALVNDMQKEICERIFKPLLYNIYILIDSLT